MKDTSFLYPKQLNKIAVYVRSIAIIVLVILMAISVFPAMAAGNQSGEMPMVKNSPLAGSISGLDNLSYSVLQGWKYLDSDAVVTSGSNNWTNGYIDVAMTSNGTVSDQLRIVSSGSLSVSGDAVSWAGTRIGTIDSVRNGANGQPLRINFSGSLLNAGFESGDLSGWTVNTNFPGLSGDTPTGITQTATVQSGTKYSGSYAAKLDITGSVVVSCGTAHGPEITSSLFYAQAGNALSLNWNALQTSDYYDVYGYVINPSNYQKQQLFYGRGATTGGWITTNATINTTVCPSGTCGLQFQFLAGTQDATCGNAVGSTLFIDGINVVTATATDVAANYIVNHIEYQNTALESAGSKQYTLTLADSASTGSASASITISKVNSTTTINSFSPEPSVIGQNYTVSVTVSSAVATPTGSVSINDGLGNSCSATLSGGTGSCSLPGNTLGTKTITANYPGTAAGLNASSDSKTHTVDKANTTTTITSDVPDPSVYGNNYPVAVTVVSVTTGTPAGTVSVNDGANNCTITLSGGTGSCNLPSTSFGTKTLTAVYGGDANYNGSSDTEAHNVIKANTASSVVASLGSPVYGQPLYLTATITATNGSYTPVGQVQFYVDGAAFGSPVPLNGSGVGVSQTTTTMNAGSHTYYAAYLGDSNNNSNDSLPAAALSMAKANTTTTIDSALPEPSVYGNSYTVSVSIASVTTGTPTGTVSVTDGTNNCTITLSGGAGSCNLPSDLASLKTLTATYAATANFNGSSDTEGHTIDKANTAASVVPSVGSPVYGQPLYLTATVTTTNGTFTPTGQVQFYVDGATFGSPVTLNGSGVATSQTTTSLNAGSHNYSVTYFGDDNNNTSNSLPAAALSIAKANTTITVLSSGPTSVYGQPFHLTATVLPVSPSIVTPIGQVQFYFDGSPLGSPVSLSSGQAVSADVHALLGSYPLVGSHTFSAAYLVSANWLASSSGSPQAQMINPASTTLVVTPDGNPVVYGTSVEMTVTVSAGGGSLAAPAGTVQLTIDGVNYGSPLTLNSAGTATRMVVYLNLWPGHHAIRGFYTPAVPAQFTASDNDATPLDQVVNKANPIITITPDVVSPVASQTVNYAVSVDPAMVTQGIPTGTIQFYVDGVAYGSPVVLDSAGKATLPILLSAGSHAVTISYSGDDYFLSVPVSPAVNQTVAKADSTSQIVSIDPTTSVVGQPVTVSVKVLPVAPATAAPGGTVLVSNGAVNCIVTLDVTGAGSCLLTPTSPGFPDLSAVYAGSSEFNGSSAAAFAGPVVSKADSSVNITGFVPAAPVVGQAVTIQFQVTASAPGAGTPGGDVTVDAGGGQTCTAIASGPTSSGSCSLTFGLAHTVAIYASYTGDSNFNASSTSSAVDLAIQKAVTALALTANSSPSVYGEAVHFTASLSVTTPGAGSPTGSIQFTIDGSAYGSPVILNGSTAVSPDISTLAVATHTIGATYLGDANFLSASSSPINQVVNKADTSLSLESSLNPSPYGISVLITATVIAAPPSYATPQAGSVQFYVDGVPYGAAVSLDANGKASKELPYTALWVGTHSITSVYSGSSNFNGSNNNASPLMQVVEKGGVNISLHTTVASPVFGQPFGFTTTVSGIGSNIPLPTGTVQFAVDGTNLGTPVTLSAAGSAASQLIASLSVGTHAVSVSYSGDDYYAAKVLNVAAGAVVAKASVNAAISNAPFAPVVVGQPVPVTYSITAAAPGVGTPTGTVTISNGTNSCTASVSAGTCSLIPSATGSPQLTLSYTGDSNFNSATAGPIDGPVVNPAATTLVVTTDGTPVVYGTTVTLTVTVSANAPSTAIPDGTVQLSIDGVDYGSPLTLNASGVASRTVPPANLWPGTHQVRGVYTPAAPVRFAASNNNSAPLVQIVNKANPIITISPGVVGPIATQPVDFTVTVAPTMPTQGTPSGTVQFFVDGVANGSPHTLNGSGLALQSIQLESGPHAITVSYSGDNYFLAVPVSLALNMTAAKADSKVEILSIDPTNTVVGNPVIVNVKVEPQSPATGIPGGTVLVSNGADSCLVTLNGVGEGSCALVPGLPGQPDLRATYVGSANFNGSISDPYPGPVVAKFDASLVITDISPTSPVTGQTVIISFAATPISPGFGIPTGTVTISDGQGRTCSGTLAPVTATGSCSIVFDQAGATSLTASYSGDQNFNSGSNAPIAGPVIQKAATALVLSTSKTPSVYGEVIRFNADLSVTDPGAGSPTGFIQFSIDGNPFGSPVALGGASTVSSDISTLTAATHTIEASYLGDANFLNTSAPTIDQVVHKADTLLVLESDPNPSPYGIPVLVTATLTAPVPSTANPIGGSVQFYVDGVAYGAPVLLRLDSKAENLLPYTALWVGTHSLTAVYSGDSYFNGSNNNASPLDQVVNKGILTITLDTTIASPVFGQSFGFTTTVSGVGANNPLPTGTVQFSVDGNNLGAPVSLDASGAAASQLIASLSVGTHAVQISYSGDDYYAATDLDVSAGVVIAKAGVNAAISNAPFAAVVVGQPVTVNFTVTAAAPGAGTPTGMVTISNGVDSCTASVSAGTCSLVPSTTGSPQLTLSYVGDGNFNTGAVIPVDGPVVEKADVSVVIDSITPMAVAVGQSYLVSVQMTPVPQGTLIPVGATLTIGNGTDTCSAVVQSDGSASCSLTPTQAGAPDLSASFVGSADFNAATSPSVSGPEVSPADTSTGLVPSINPAVLGREVHFTATVQTLAPGGGIPTGTVQFQIDGADFGAPAALVNGEAVSASIDTLVLGNHAVTAQYVGNANYTTSISNALTEKIVEGNLSGEVTPAGGTLVFHGTMRGLPVTTTIEVPAGAVSGNVTLIYHQFYNSLLIPPSGDQFVASFTLDVYIDGVLQPNFVFDLPISITLTYNPSGWNENTFVVSEWTGLAWSTDGTNITDHDMDGDAITFTLDSTGASEFSLSGMPSHSIFIPLIRR